MRFEIPERAGEINRTPSQINFLDPRLKSDKKTILKSLSQDLSLIFNPDALEDASEPKMLKFTEVIQKIIKDMNLVYKENLSSQLDETIVDKQFVNVPSLQEMEKTLHYFKSVNLHLEDKLKASVAPRTAPAKEGAMEIEGTTPQTPVVKTKRPKFNGTNMYHLIISEMFIFSLRFFMSQKTSKLHLLKNKFYLENFDKEGVSPIEKLNSVVKSLKKFVKTLKGLMTEKFNTDYLDLLKKIACLIGYRAEKIVNKTVTENNERVKAKQYLSNLAFGIMKELINYDDAESQTIDVLYSFISQVKFNDQFVLKNK